MTKKILIVEDEFQIIKLITAILSQKGYEIDYCENGRDAIAKMQDFKPDLVLMDIMLPGIDGKTLAKQMLSIRDLASIPVIIISSLKDANTLFSDSQQVRGVVSKPFKQQTLVDAVEKVLPTA
ncbi:MAG: response regulator [Elusimicrobiaceae bacterium]|nr:response regulator [Elusimicrobiaceae bacterium]MBT3955622.1 response regulator [Elusimicrobiaceae bacterium]MBT4008736.1 response regulator [Elusimicrobiaceae bacterium]MBT4402777.1 response regulator [Elusimicrobiaceae bacterium]MBT4439588.1 response regulator [Elusimicrobiaceae bacterium]